MAPKIKRKLTKYKTSLELTHAVLKPNGAVQVIDCQFCIAFGREANIAVVAAAVGSGGNKGGREMPPPVMPLGLADMHISVFQDIVAGVKDMLVLTFFPNAPKQACKDHHALKRDIQNSQSLKKRFKDACEGPAFQQCWNPAASKYGLLRKLAGGFASFFPGGRAVESDFSILNQDKSPQRSRLADLSTEEGFHARRWPLMEEFEAACRVVVSCSRVLT